MIEDKELGLKMTESVEETIWERVREAREASIKQLYESLIIEKAILNLAESKLIEIAESESTEM